MPRASLKRRLASSSEDGDRPEPGPSQRQAPHASARLEGALRRRIKKGDADAPLDDGEPDDTPLNDSLIRTWALGELTSPKVQELALVALKQGAHSVEVMARAGCSGKRPDNMHRAMVAALGHPTGAPPIDWVDIPLLNKEKCQPHPFIFPHKLFQRLASAKPSWGQKATRLRSGAPTRGEQLSPLIQCCGRKATWRLRALYPLVCMGMAALSPNTTP